MLPFLTDLAVFLLLPLLVWRLVRPVVPLAVVPVLVGLAVAGLAALNGQQGPQFLAPTAVGDALGMLGVILLAFSAGLEGRDPGHLTPGHLASGLAERAPPSPGHILRSAGVALTLPFVAGTALAWGLLSVAEGWQPDGLPKELAAASIGLCLAVSALPVLVALLRELPSGLRPLGAVAVRVAALDDMALWLGLGLLMALGRSQAVSVGFGPADVLALLVLGTLPFLLSFLGQVRGGSGPGHPLPVWGGAAVVLTVSSLATAQLGLHAVLGAYFAGMILPARWAARLPEQTIGRWALLGLAPLFFGHRGLAIDPRLLTPDVLGWMALLLLASMVTKIVAVQWVPPVPGLSRHRRLTLGVFLQCKGLMEIVAATLLMNSGLLTATTYAALVMLALVSTTLTAPLIRLLTPGCLEPETAKMSGIPDGCRVSGKSDIA